MKLSTNDQVCVIRSRHSGFTLTELLVVIAIIGILIAMLIPAVQAVREAARSVQCKNHIRQMAIAAHNLESATQELPGYAGERLSGNIVSEVGDADPSMLGWNWITRIMPFMEQETLAVEWGRINKTIAPVTSLSDRELIATAIEVLHCPSRREARAYPTAGRTGQYFGGPAARTDYAMNGGSGRPMNINGLRIGLRIEKSGVWRIGKTSKLRDAVDGTSATYFIGEKSMEPEHYTTGKSQGDYGAAFGSAPHLTATPAYVRFAARSPRVDKLQKGRCTSCHDFGSAHPTTMNMAYLDGSVHSISYTIDLEVYKAMASINGGETISD
ncbi:MAG: DUF1559 domain-containing protein [Planctomycetota bacterium]